MDARKLVGMSQRRRKEMFHAEFEAARNKDGTVSMFVADALLSRWRIGQSLRPCPGCEQCSDSPRLAVKAVSTPVVITQALDPGIELGPPVIGGVKNPHADMGAPSPRTRKAPAKKAKVKQ